MTKNSRERLSGRAASDLDYASEPSVVHQRCKHPTNQRLFNFLSSLFSCPRRPGGQPARDCAGKRVKGELCSLGSVVSRENFYVHEDLVPHHWAPSKVHCELGCGRRTGLKNPGTSGRFGFTEDWLPWVYNHLSLLPRACLPVLPALLRAL